VSSSPGLDSPGSSNVLGRQGNRDRCDRLATKGVVRPPTTGFVALRSSASVTPGHRSVADPIAPVAVELAIAFGDCDRPPWGAECWYHANSPASGALVAR
jgi:hypothetical protein